jgi:cation-transporting ATPase 13A3/4/5
MKNMLRVILLTTCGDLAIDVMFPLDSTIIVITTIGSLISELRTSVKNENYLRSLVECNQRVRVCRDGEVKLIEACDVVVGDVVVVENNDKAVADMVLIQGEVVMDESSVTGESHPIAKAKIKPNEDGKYVYVHEKHRLCTLFSGSQVVQTKVHVSSETKNPLKSECLAVVLSTAYSTTKGELFRGILFPTKFKFKFQRGELCLSLTRTYLTKLQIPTISSPFYPHSLWLH